METQAYRTDIDYSPASADAIQDKEEFLNCVDDSPKPIMNSFREESPRVSLKHFSKSGSTDSNSPSEVSEGHVPGSFRRISELNILKNRILFLERSMSSQPPPTVSTIDPRVDSLLSRISGLEDENKYLRIAMQENVVRMESRLKEMEAEITERTNASISKLASIVHQLLERQRRPPSQSSSDKENALSELNREIAYIKRNVR